MIEYESDPVLSANEHFPSFEERVRASHRGGRPGSPCHSAHGNLYRATLLQQQLKRAKKVSFHSFINIHPFIRPSIHPSIHAFIHLFIYCFSHSMLKHLPHWFIAKCSKLIQRLPPYLPNKVVIPVNICVIILYESHWLFTVYFIRSDSTETEIDSSREWFMLFLQNDFALLSHCFASWPTVRLGIRMQCLMECGIFSQLTGRRKSRPSTS